MSFVEIVIAVMILMILVETVIIFASLPEAATAARRGIHRIRRHAPCDDGHLKVVQKTVPATNEIALRCDTCGVEDVLQEYHIGGTLWMRGIVLEEQRTEKIRKQEILHATFHADELEAWRKDHQ